MNHSVLLISHINILNANALSSPFTIGFPAMTAWLGAVHALQRRLNSDIVFDGVGLVCHQFNLQTHRGPGDFVNSIIGTANPINKNGSRPAFIEEARCHLDVSLVIQLPSVTMTEQEQLKENVNHLLHSGLKMASGDIQSFGQIEIFADFSMLKRKLMPGYTLLERRDLMIQDMEAGQDALGAMLDYLLTHQRCEQAEDGTIQWFKGRKPTGPDNVKGWIVPIATGFRGISDLGTAINQRDADTPHRFAESLVTLGEFKMPYRLNDISELLWHYRFDPKNNLYLCEQTSTTFEEDGF